MPSSGPPGRLLLVGGEAGGIWDAPEILDELVRLAGGAGLARVVLASIIGRDDREPAEAAARAALARLGVADFRSLTLDGPGDVDRARALGIIERATALILDGMDPEQLVRSLRETRLDATIRRRLGDSLLVVGVGQVAVALGGRMLVDDVLDPDHGPLPERTEPITGLDYLPGVVLDPFFFRDRRPDRLISALAEGPDDLGIGIEAATALIVDRGVLSVLGRGKATIVDRSRATRGAATWRSVGPGERFDLATRAPITP